jgi:predicted DCC family thiol-disulfide oxidoreductase YuxK
VNHPVVLFDGVCNLCNGAVQFIVKRDPHGLFHFASLQSDAARRLAGPQATALDTFLLWEDGVIYARSTAALRVARRLRGIVRLASILLLVPRPIRDAVYSYIARRRYKWFGKRDVCMVPTPEQRSRFLD